MPPPPPPKKPTEPQGKNERNEYIPSFISKKPFYIDDATASQEDYLEHQRLQAQKDESLATQKWYTRGQRSGAVAATKFRKGACENCGAMGHQKKDCLYRQRKIGAKFTGKDIKADESGQDINMGWEAKRDRWSGYDARAYQEVVNEYNDLQAIKDSKRKLEDTAEGDEDEDAAHKAEDGDKYEEETDMGRKQPNSSRNLRLREDTAGYLKNLDLESAKYDPKTRTLIDDAEGEFERASGDAAEFARAQRYAWETAETNGSNNVHLQANPTAGEHYRKKEAEETAAKKEAHRKALLEKYGGQEHLKPDPLKHATITENERYVEYDERGRIKGAPEKKEKSMYAEDVMLNNHTSVFGSWWKNFTWGYACCHSTMKNSYCVGDAGKVASSNAEKLSTGALLEAAPETLESNATEVPKSIAWKEEERNEEHVPNASDRAEKAKLDESTGEDRKRKLDEMRSGVTEEEMDEYRRKRNAGNDPMAALLGKDELLD
ncbi:hypothetical protein D6C86_00027 [Aureobasidium pullulans]|uniref:Pre-mRNA-splicing factor SLU7 n=1 Tax=Aureobasidium pullulans TaxID=5580 RepID=A0A4S9UP61_AURPU|nr:hypothetical protein D6C94_00564 [Aureobasidium pullulans]THZ39608.1 hypothetical protein D6C87_07012 [Aureobasidium pullulans]THZ68158.1 hypothetical protein D6C86_00027 [Aureobasidium pullulans]THZ90065.1 hypothetical protein D6C88_04325 [Aureobasidium pullulans]